MQSNSPNFHPGAFVKSNFEPASKQLNSIGENYKRRRRGAMLEAGVWGLLGSPIAGAAYAGVSMAGARMDKANETMRVLDQLAEQSKVLVRSFKDASAGMRKEAQLWKQQERRNRRAWAKQMEPTARRWSEFGREQTDWRSEMDRREAKMMEPWSERKLKDAERQHKQNKMWAELHMSFREGWNKVALKLDDVKRSIKGWTTARGLARKFDQTWGEGIRDAASRGAQAVRGWFSGEKTDADKRAMPGFTGDDLASAEVAWWKKNRESLEGDELATKRARRRWKTIRRRAADGKMTKEEIDELRQDVLNNEGKDPILPHWDRNDTAKEQENEINQLGETRDDENENDEPQARTKTRSPAATQGALASTGGANINVQLNMQGFDEIHQQMAQAHGQIWAKLNQLSAEQQLRQYSDDITGALA
jgi:hypothetical protein